VFAVASERGTAVRFIGTLNVTRIWGLGWTVKE
jgi:hypothetical protein